jgi:hypothetical protein
MLSGTNCFDSSIADIGELSSVIPDRPRSGLIRNLVTSAEDSGFARVARAPE